MKMLKRIANAWTSALLATALLTSPALAVGGKSTAFATAVLNLVFKGTTITGIADNTATSAATVICVALHTADPGVGGSMSTNEAAYTSYARVAVTRGSGWTVTGTSVSPTAAINFPAASGGSETETWFSAGVPTSGSTCTGTLVILYRGTITPNLAVSNGVTPQLTTSTAITEQ